MRKLLLLALVSVVVLSVTACKKEASLAGTRWYGGFELQVDSYPGGLYYLLSEDSFFLKRRMRGE